jgi:hypothetical protein
VTDATSRTLRNELWRSLPSGVIDTLTATFGMLIAVRVFHMGDAAKSLFLSATSGGMVASLFVVPLLLRAKSTLPRTAAKVQILGGACMAVSAAFPHDSRLYIGGLSLGLFCLAMQIPLLTQIYRINYPAAARGKLYAVTGVTRAAAARRRHDEADVATGSGPVLGLGFCRPNCLGAKQDQACHQTGREGTSGPGSAGQWLGESRHGKLH